MIYYNNEAGKLLKANSTGILRSHSPPDQERLERWAAIDPCLSKLAYSSATYCVAGSATQHWGLGLSDYTHASSPLRRYADLYNQRCLIDILNGTPVVKNPAGLCRNLNTLGRNAKSFERDIFFLQALTKKGSVEARVLEIQETKQALQLWVPSWNRVIRVKLPIKDTRDPFTISIGQILTLTYYVQYQNARWKDKIIFNLSPLPP